MLPIIRHCDSFLIAEHPQICQRILNSLKGQPSKAQPSELQMQWMHKDQVICQISATFNYFLILFPYKNKGAFAEKVMIIFSSHSVDHAMSLLRCACILHERKCTLRQASNHLMKESLLCFSRGQPGVWRQTQLWKLNRSRFGSWLYHLI